MPIVEYDGKTWDIPWVSRERTVRLQHPTPDLVDAYVCQWTDGLDASKWEEAMPQFEKQPPSTIQLVKDADGVHVGVLRMSLVPGQEGVLQCKTGVYKEAYVREMNNSLQAYSEWTWKNPGEEPSFEMVWSDWSNTLPIGTVEPDPVPEPGLVLMLVAGILGLVVAGWRRKTR